MNEQTRRTVRTAFQATISVATVLVLAVPVFLSAVQIALTPAQYAVVASSGAAIVGVATGLTRVMQLPQVVSLIDTYAPWLSAGRTTSPPTE